MIGRNNQKLNLLMSEEKEKESYSDLERDVLTLKSLQEELVNVDLDELEAKEQLESILKLERDLRDLREINMSFSELIEVQGEQLDQSEKQIENTTTQTEQAVAHLEKATGFAELFRSRTVRTVGGALAGATLLGGGGFLLAGYLGIVAGIGIGTSSGAVVGALSA